MLNFILMPNTIVAGSQVEVLNVGNEYIDDKMKKCSERFQLLKKLLKDVKGVVLKEAKGAFYAVLAIDSLINFETS